MCIMTLWCWMDVLFLVHILFLGSFVDIPRVLSDCCWFGFRDVGKCFPDELHTYRPVVDKTLPNEVCNSG